MSTSSLRSRPKKNIWTYPMEICSSVRPPASQSRNAARARGCALSYDGQSSRVHPFRSGFIQYTGRSGSIREGSVQYPVADGASDPT